MLKLGLGLGRKAIGGGQDAPTNDLSGSVASTIFELDATNSDSYGGTGTTWANLTASPADGVSQSIYDFYLGKAATVDGDEPTFTGTAGNTAAYFSLDGADAFAVSDWTNATSLRQFHRTDITSGFWLTLLFRTDAAVAGGFDYIFGSGARSTADIGFGLLLSAAGEITFVTSNGSTRRTVVIASAGSLVGDTDYCLTVSVDPSVDSVGVDNLRAWINGVSTYSDRWGWGTQDADASEGGFALGALFDEGNFFNNMTSGTRIYGAALGNEFLTDDSDITSYFELKHGRTYT